MTQVKTADVHNAEFTIICTEADDIVRGHETVFLPQLDDIIFVAPRETALEPEQSPGSEKAKLFIEAKLRQMPLKDMTPSLAGVGAFEPMGYQVEVVDKALRQMRNALILADAVGLDKPIEIGIPVSEASQYSIADTLKCAPH